MVEWDGWQWLLWAAIGVAAFIFTAIGVALLRLRSSLARRVGRNAQRQSWHAETADPVARLRSPYKTEPLCSRCLAIAAPGERAFFMCRLNEQCGLLEDEPVARR